jgi:sulfate adenylyltransferase
MIEAYGAFVEVHVATSSRNASGATARGSTSWRARARSRSSPASPTPTRRPPSAELVVDTEGTEVDYCAQQVLLKLESMGLIA